MSGGADVEISVGIRTSFIHSLLAGGFAGLSVDLILYPIDTLKTRLQAPQGFLKSGGTVGIYDGIGAVSVGSAPGAALFFVTYEGLKPIIGNMIGGVDGRDKYVHMSAASIGEVVACLVRVPTEVVKSRMQTSAGSANVGMAKTARAIVLETNGKGFGNLYRGFGATILREVPFAFIQFPVYERLKIEWTEARCGKPVTPIQAAACGSLGGAVAAALTTPLDVVKTRLMLGKDIGGKAYSGVMEVISRSIAEDGAIVLMKGIGPRVMWIGIGGFVFFGAYDMGRIALLSS